MLHEYFTQLRTATPHVTILSHLNGLNEVAEEVQNMEKLFSNVFWNTPPRASIPTDAEYIGMVIGILKKRAGKKGVEGAMKLIKMLEERNAQ